MINSIKAVGNSVYILKDSDLYAMDNYSSSLGLSLVLSDVSYFDASPRGCVAIKKDNTVWYCGDALTSLDDDIIEDFIDITSDFSNFDLSKGTIYKTYNGMFFLDNKGILYARGHNRNGELMMGTGSYYKFYPEFKQTVVNDVASFIEAGEATAFYVSTDGNTYGCGYNSGEINFTRGESITGVTTTPQKLKLSYKQLYVKPYGIMYTFQNSLVFLGNNINNQFGANTVGELRDVHKFHDSFSAYNMSPYDTSGITITNNKLKGTGIVASKFYNGFTDLPFTLPDNLKKVKLIYNNKNAIFITDGTDVYYVGFLDGTYKDTFTKIDFTNSTSTTIFKSNSTSSSFVLNSINNDISFNTFVDKSTFPIKDSNDVYFSANTKDGKSALKISYDKKVYFFGDPQIIGIKGDPSTEWTECTDIFKQVRLVYDNLLHSNYNITNSGVQVMIPRGHIYSIGSSVNGDLGTRSGSYDGKTIVHFNRLVRTNAINAALLDSTGEFSYYINNNNDIYITGDSSWVDPTQSMYKAFTKLPIDKKSYDNLVAVKKSSLFFKLGNDIYVLGDVKNGEGGIKPDVYKKPTKVPLPDGLTANDIQVFDKGTTTPFMYFMTTKGVFYGSGKFPPGTSGVSTENDLTSFTKLPLTLPTGVDVKDVLGLNSSSKTLLMITNTKSVYFCGSSEHIIDPTNTNVVLNWTDKDIHDTIATDFTINPIEEDMYFCGMRGIKAPSITVIPENASGYELTKIQIEPTDTSILSQSRCPYNESTDTFNIPFLNANSISQLDLKYTLTNHDGSTISKTYSKQFYEIFISVFDMNTTVGSTVTLEPKFYKATNTKLTSFVEYDADSVKKFADLINIKFNRGVYSASTGNIDWDKTDTGCLNFTGKATEAGKYGTNLISYYKDYNINLRIVQDIKPVTKKELEKILSKDELNLLSKTEQKSSFSGIIPRNNDFSQIINISKESLYDDILDILHIKHK